MVSKSDINILPDSTGMVRMGRPLEYSFQDTDSLIRMQKPDANSNLAGLDLRFAAGASSGTGKPGVLSLYSRTTNDDYVASAEIKLEEYTGMFTKGVVTIDGHIVLSRCTKTASTDTACNSTSRVITSELVTGSNAAGVDLVLQAGVGTGSGTRGKLSFQVPRRPSDYTTNAGSEHRLKNILELYEDDAGTALAQLDAKFMIGNSTTTKFYVDDDGNITATRLDLTSALPGVSGGGSGSIVTPGGISALLDSHFNASVHAKALVGTGMVQRQDVDVQTVDFATTPFSVILGTTHASVTTKAFDVANAPQGAFFFFMPSYGAPTLFSCSGGVGVTLDAGSTNMVLCETTTNAKLLGFNTTLVSAAATSNAVGLWAQNDGGGIEIKSGTSATAASTAESLILISAATYGMGKVNISAGSNGVYLESANMIDLSADKTMSFTSSSGGLSVTASAGDITMSTNQSISLTSSEGVFDAIRLHASSSSGGIDIDSGLAGIDMVSTGKIDLAAAAVASAFTLASDTDTDDLSIGVTGATDSSLHLYSAGTGVDALSIKATSSMGGIDINAGNYGIDVDTTGSFTLNAAGNSSWVIFTADAAGEDLTIQQAGALDASLNLLSAGTGFDAITMNATSGGMDVNIGTSGLDLDTTGAIALDSDGAASHFTVTADAAGEDLTISQDGAVDASVVITSAGTAFDSVQINAGSGSTGGMDVNIGTFGLDLDTTGAIALDSDGAASHFTVTADAAGEDLTISQDGAVDASVVITSAGTAFDSVQINAGSGSTGGMDVNIGTFGLDLDTTGAIALDSDGAASHFTVTADAAGEDLTISQDGAVDASVVITSAGTAFDSVQINAGSGSTGGMDVNIGTFGLDLDTTGAIALDSDGAASHFTVTADADGEDLTISQDGIFDASVAISSAGTAADAVSIQSGVGSTGGIDVDAGSTGIDLSTTGPFKVTSDNAGTLGDITIDAKDSRLYLQSGQSVSNAINVRAYGADGGIAVSANDGGLDVDSTADVTVDADDAISITAMEDTVKAISLHAGGSHGGISAESGLGGMTLQSEGSLFGSFYGVHIESTALAPGGDIVLDATNAMVTLDGGEPSANAVYLMASHRDGGVMIHGGVDGAGTVTVQSGTGGIDVESLGASEIRTKGGDNRFYSETQRVVIESERASTDSVRIHAKGTTGGIDIDSGTGGINMASTNTMDLITTGGVMTLDGTSSSVVVQSRKESSDAVHLRATGDDGGVKVQAEAGGMTVQTVMGDISMTAQDAVVDLESTLASTSAISLVASDAEGGIAMHAGTHGSGVVEIVAGSGGVVGSATGPLVGTFYGAVVTSYGPAGDVGDVRIEATQSAVNIDGGEDDPAAVRILTSNPNGGIDVDSGLGGIDMQSAGAMDLRTLDGELTINSTNSRLVFYTSSPLVDSIKIQASNADGGIDIDSGDGGIDVQSTSTIHFLTLNGELTMNSTHSSVVATSNKAASDAVRFEALNDAGGLLFKGKQGGVRIYSDDGVSEIESTLASSAAVSMVASDAEGGITLHAGAHGSGIVEVVSGSGGVVASSTGPLVGTFYGVVVTSYGPEGDVGDVRVEATQSAVNIDGGEDAKDAVVVTASAPSGGVKIVAGTVSNGAISMQSGGGGISASTAGAILHTADKAVSVESMSDGVSIYAKGGGDIAAMSQSGAVIIDAGGATSHAISMSATHSSGGIAAASGTGGISLASTGVIMAESTGPGRGAVTVAATNDEGGVVISGGASMNGTVEVLAGTGGLTETSFYGMYTGTFYGSEVVTGGPAGDGDIRMTSTWGSVAAFAGAASATAVEVAATHPDGGISVSSGLEGQGSVAVTAGGGGTRVTSKGHVDVTTESGMHVVAEDEDAFAISLSSTSPSGGIAMSAGIAGDGRLTGESGTGGMSLVSTGSLFGSFYGALVQSFGESDESDIVLHARQASVLVQGNEDAPDAVALTASHRDGGVTIAAGTGGSGTIDTVSGTGGTTFYSKGNMQLKTRGDGDKYSLVVEGGGTSAGAVTLRNAAAAGGILVSSGTGGTVVDSTGSIDVTTTTTGKVTVSAQTGGVEVKSTSGGVTLNAVSSDVDIKSDSSSSVAVSISATDSSGGVAISAGTSGAGVIDLTSGTGGISAASSGPLLGTFYGATIQSYGPAGDDGDINLQATQSSVVIEGMEASTAAVAISATDSSGGVTITAGNNIDATSSGTMTLATTGGDLTAKSTGYSVILESDEAASDAVKLYASSASGGVTISSAGSIDLATVSGEITAKSTGARVVVESDKSASDAIYLYAPNGGIDVYSVGDDVKVRSSKGVQVTSSEDSSAAVSISATDSSGGVAISAGTSGAGVIDLTSGTGGMSAASSGPLLGTFYGATIQSYGPAGDDGDINLQATQSSVVIEGMEASTAAVAISATDSSGGVTITAGNNIDATSSGTMTLATTGGDLTAKSTGYSVILESDEAASDAVKLYASSASGGVTISSAGTVDLETASGDLTLKSTGSRVVVTGEGTASDTVYLYAPNGGIDVYSVGDDVKVRSSKGVQVTSSEDSSAAVSISATDSSGGVAISAGTSGAGVIDLTSGTGGISAASSGPLLGTFYGATIQSYGPAGDDGDINLQATQSSVVIEGMEASTAAVAISATDSSGGVTITAGNNIDATSSGTMTLATTGGDLTAKSTGYSVILESDEAASDAVKLYASSASGGVTISSAGTVDLETASGDLTLKSTGSRVVVTGEGTASDTVYLYAPNGGIDVYSVGDDVKVRSSKGVQVTSSEDSSAAVSISATDSSGGVAISAGTSGAGVIDLTSGTGGMSAASSGPLLGTFYGATIQSYGPAGDDGDINLQATQSSVVIEGMEASTAAVAISATDSSGGVTITAGNNIDATSSGTMTLATTGGDLTAKSTGYSVILESDEAASDAVKLYASSASGGVTISSAGTVDLETASGDLTLKSTGSRVVVTGEGTASDTVYLYAPNGGIDVYSVGDDVKVRSSKGVQVTSSEDSSAAVSISATDSSGGVAISAGSSGAGVIDLTSGTGGISAASSGPLLGTFYGATIQSYGPAGDDGDINLQATQSSVVIEGMEASTAAVAISATDSSGGVTITAGNNIDATSSGTMTLATTGGDLTAKSTGYSVILESDEAASDAVKLYASSASGGVTISSAGTIDLETSSSDLTLKSTGSRVVVTGEGTASDTVYLYAPNGGIDVYSVGDDVKVRSSKGVQVTSSEDSSAAVSISATDSSGGVAISAGSSGAGVIDLTSGTGGMSAASSGPLLGTFYGATIQSYGPAGDDGDINLQATQSSVVIEGMEASTAAVAISATDSSGGVTITAGNNIDATSSGTMTLATTGGDLTAKSTGYSVILESDEAASDAVKLYASSASGGVTISSAGTIDLETSSSDLTLKSTGSRVVVTGEGTASDTVYLYAPNGGIDVYSVGDDVKVRSSKGVQVTSSEDSSAAVSISATDSSGGVAISAGSSGAGVIDLTSGTGGISAASSGPLLGTFYGTTIQSYGPAGDDGDINLQATQSSVVIEGMEASTAAVAISATDSSGGVTITAGNNIDATSSGTMTLATTGGDLTAKSTGYSVILESDEAASDAVKLYASSASGGVTISSAGTVDLETSSSDLTLKSTGSRVVVTGEGTASDTVYLYAPNGGIDVYSAGDDVKVRSSKGVQVTSSEDSSAAVSISATDSSGGVAISAGSSGAGVIDLTSGTGGISAASSGPLLGTFYGTTIQSYGPAGDDGDINLQATQSSVVIEGMEASTAAVAISATDSSGGVTITAGNNIDATSSGTMTLATTGGDLTAKSTGYSVILESDEAASDAVKLYASSASGGVTISSAGTIDLETSSSDLTLKSTGSRVVVTGEGTASDTVYLYAPNGGIDVYSVGDDVKVRSSKGVQVTSSEDSSAAVSISATDSSGGVAISAGSSGAGVIDLTSGTGGISAASSGPLLGTFYGATIQSYGPAGDDGDINLQATQSSVVIEGMEASTAAVAISATDSSGGVTITAGNNIDATSSGTMTLATTGGDLTAKSTGYSVILESDEAASDAVKLYASSASGGVTISSAGTVDLETSSSDLTLKSTGSRVVVTGEGTASDTVYLYAPNGGIDVYSAGDDVKVRSSKGVQVTSSEDSSAAVSISATDSSGGVAISAGSSGAGVIDLTSGTGGISAASSGPLLGTFYGTTIQSYGPAGDDGDINLQATQSSVVIEGMEASTAAVAISATDSSGGVTITAGNNIDATSSGTMTLATTGGDLTAKSTGYSVILESDEAASDAVKLYASSASGGVTISSAGSITVDSAGTLDFSTTSSDLTVKSTGARVVVESDKSASDAIYLYAPNGGIDVYSVGDDVKVRSSKGVQVTSSEDSSAAVSISATDSSGGVAISAGSSGAGVIDLTSGTGGMSAASSGPLLGTFYGVTMQSYGPSGSEGDVTIEATQSAVNLAGIGVELDGGSGGVSMTTTSSVAFSLGGSYSTTAKLAVTQGSSGAVAVAASSGELALSSTATSADVSVTSSSGRVVLDGGSSGTDAVRIKTKTSGGVDVDSGTGGFDVQSTGDVALKSSGSAVALESSKSSGSAVSITASGSDGGVSITAGAAGSGALEVDTGTGGVFMTSDGALFGSFYGIELQSADTFTVSKGEMVVAEAATFTRGAQSSSVSRTATTSGDGSGRIEAGTAFVSVSSTSTARFVTLPSPVVGNVVKIAAGTTGFKLRSSTPLTIAINGGTGASASSSVAASSLVECTCTSSTAWLCVKYTTSSIGMLSAAA